MGRAPGRDPGGQRSRLLLPSGADRRLAGARTVDGDGDGGARARRGGGGAMKDPRIDGLAKVIVNYSLELKAGQTFFISSGAVAEPLVQALYEETLRAGANPVLDLSLEGTQPAFFELASDAQIEWISPTQQWAFNEADARMRILSDTNVRELSSVPPEKQTRRQKAMHPYMQRMMERSAAGDLRWNVTLFPTNAYAAEAGMSLRRVRGLLLPRLPLRPARPGRRLGAGRGGDLPPRRLDRGARGGPHPGARDRPEAERRRPPLQAGRRQVQHARRRVLHRPGRGLGRGRDHLPPAGDLRRPRGRRRPTSASRAARSSTPPPSAARTS